MSDLVRVSIGGFEKNVGAAFAAQHDLTPLDESPRKSDGSLRPATRSGGRRVKPRTTVAKSAAAKKAVTKPADDKKE